MPTTSPSGRKPADAAAGRADVARLGLSHKTFDVEFKDVDDAGSVTMYAAIFGNVDRGGDVIDPGAFDNLADFAREGFIALSHDSKALPVAYPTAAVQDDRGLLISATFHSTPAAQAVRTVVRERMAAGKAVQASIGYICNDESFERLGGRQVRRIKKLSVFEASIVPLAMNPLAGATSAKGVPPGAPPPEESMPEPANNGSAVATLKRLLGISTKKSVAISAANREELKAFGDRMDEHHGQLAESVKGLRDCHKAMCKTCEEFKSFVGGFDPDAGDDDVEENEKPAGEVGKDDKSATPTTTPTTTPAPTEADRTRAALLAQLKRRSLAGRGSQVCP